jgi:hypothetical protein
MTPAFEEAAMKLSSSSAPRSLTAAIAALAILAPAAGAQEQDLRSPDARDAAQRVQFAGTQDLRSPDAKDAALTHRSARATAIDAQLIASSGRIAPTPPAEAVAPRARPAEDAFDWGSAAIGAGVAGGIALVAATGLGAAHRTRTRPAR